MIEFRTEDQIWRYADDVLAAYRDALLSRFAKAWCEDLDRKILGHPVIINPKREQNMSAKPTFPTNIDEAFTTACEIFIEALEEDASWFRLQAAAEVIRKHFVNHCAKAPEPAKERFPARNPWDGICFLPEHVARLCTLLERVQKEASGLDGFTRLPTDRLIDFLEAGLNRWNADLKETRAAVDKVWQEVRKVTNQREKAAV